MEGDSCPTAVSTMPIQPPWSPNGKRDQLDGSTTSGGNAQLKVARAAHRVSDVLSLQAGWITDAAALHYNTGSIPMTLSVKWNAGSGLQRNITGNGMSTLWCECTTDASRQVSHCAAIANVASTDPSASVLPSALYVHWHPRAAQLASCRECAVGPMTRMTKIVLTKRQRVPARSLDSSMVVVRLWRMWRAGRRRMLGRSLIRGMR